MFHHLQKYLNFLVLALIIFASSWALFRSDFFRFHDFTQGARIVEMASALKDGHFPVIWSANLGYGYGMPLFEFYAPLPYYFGALFYMLGISLIGSVKIILFISTFFTAIGAYWLGKRLFGELGGLITSAAVTLAPYRAVNLYVRGALSESWGIMFLPFILLGIVKTIHNEKNGWLLLVVSIFGLLISHNLTALIFLPLSILFGAGYLLIEGKSDKKIGKTLGKIVLKLGGIYILAAALSSFYTLPALLEKNFTRLDATILAEYFDYRLHYVGIRQFFIENWGYGGSTYGSMDGISFFLGFGQLFGLFFAGYIFIKEVLKSWQKKSKQVLEKRLLLSLLILVLLALSLIMTTSKSQLIWESINSLSFLQFPWRYLSAATLFLGLSIGALIILLPHKLFKSIYAFTLIAMMLLMNYKYFSPEEFTSNLSEFYYTDENKLRYQMSNTLPDYIPIQIESKIIEPPALKGQVLYCQVLDNCVSNYAITEDKVQSKKIETNYNAEQILIFSIADFPGWSTYIDGKRAGKMQSNEGFIEVLVPAGQHQVQIKLEQTQTRKAANLISATALVILSCVYFWYHKSKLIYQQKND